MLLGRGYLTKPGLVWERTADALLLADTLYIHSCQLQGPASQQSSHELVTACAAGGDARAARLPCRLRALHASGMPAWQLGEASSELTGVPTVVLVCSVRAFASLSTGVVAHS